MGSSLTFSTSSPVQLLPRLPGVVSRGPVLSTQRAPLSLSQAQWLTPASYHVIAPFYPSLVRLHSTDGKQGDYKLVYTGPLKGAVRAIKVFSLTTAVGAFFGGPILVWLGNPSVPVVARVAISSIVMLIGLSTTAILHWLMKGYVIRMEYDEESESVAAYTLSVTGRMKRNEFRLSETKPPASAGGFSSFQAAGKSYFLHTDIFHDKNLLSKLLGPYMALEDMSQSEMKK